MCASISENTMRSLLSYRDGIKADENNSSAIMTSLGQICGEMREADH